MKDIKQWLIDMENDEELLQKFDSIEDVDEIVDLAKKEGYEFTEEEFMDLQLEMVSGGSVKSFFSKLGKGVRKVIGGAFKLNGKIHETMGKIGEDHVSDILPF